MRFGNPRTFTVGVDVNTHSLLKESVVAGQKILVIDDSKVIRVRVREMLPQGNVEVLEAKDGEEGLKLIRQARPNLIMLDFLLPKVAVGKCMGSASPSGAF